MDTLEDKCIKDKCIKDKYVTLILFGEDCSKIISVTEPLSLFSKYPKSIINTLSQESSKTLEFNTIFTVDDWAKVKKVLQGEYETMLPLEIWNKAALYGLVYPEIYSIRSINRKDERFEMFICGDSDLLLLSNQQKNMYHSSLSSIPGIVSFAVLLKLSRSNSLLNSCIPHTRHIVTELKAIVVGEGCLIYYKGRNGDIRYEKRSIDLLSNLKDGLINVNKHKQLLLGSRESREFEDEDDHGGVLHICRAPTNPSAIRMKKYKREINEAIDMECVVEYNALNELLGIGNATIDSFEPDMRLILSSDNQTVLIGLSNVSLALDGCIYPNKFFEIPIDFLERKLVTLDFDPIKLVNTLNDYIEYFSTDVQEKHIGSDIVGVDRSGPYETAFYTTCHGYVRL